MNVRRVAVVGHGAAPAIAATALVRAFRRIGVAVTWIETAGGTPDPAVLMGHPNLDALHRLLGIDTGAMLRVCQGTLALGRLYRGFAGGESDYLHTFGPVGRPIAGLPFMPLWLKAREAGLPANFSDFAREAVAARHGKVALGADRAGVGATAHGYHFDTGAYAAALRGHAIREGVTIVAAKGAQPVAGDGRITAIRVSDGEAIETDLIVDTTADAAMLAALGDGAPAGAAVSGCNRLLVGSGASLAPLPLYSRVATHRAGWCALQPLQDRTGVAIAFDDRLMDVREAVFKSPIALEAPPHEIALKPHWRRAPWTGNVVAIGAAAGTLEPLDATELHRLQIAVTHLVSLFPVRSDQMPEAAIYNEELREWHARLQDYAAMPYILNGRRGEPFWAEARERPVSEALRSRIDLFAARGMVAQYNQDTLTEDEWQTCFLGLGLRPRAWDPQIDRVDEQLAMAAFREQLTSIREEVTRMETHAVALQKVMARG